MSGGKFISYDELKMRAKIAGVSLLEYATGVENQYCNLGRNGDIAMLIDDDGGIVCIDGDGERPDAPDEIGTGAFYNCSGLTNVTIPYGVMYIRSYAFCDCSGITSVTIPDSVTSIGTSAFSGCSGLTSVTIPDSVKSIGECAFWGCTGLTSVTIGNGVTYIGRSAFEGCSGLTSVTIPGSVTNIRWYAFRGCTSLTSVTIPGSVTSIWDDAFYGCRLDELVLRGRTEDEVRAMEYYPWGLCKSIIRCEP